MRINTTAKSDYPSAWVCDNLVPRLQSPVCVSLCILAVLGEWSLGIRLHVASSPKHQP